MTGVTPNAEVYAVHASEEPTYGSDRSICVVLAVPPRQAATHRGWIEVPRQGNRHALVRNLPPLDAVLR